MIILKVTRSQGFTLYLEDTFFEKPTEGGRGGGGLTPTAGLGLINFNDIFHCSEKTRL